jgi:hypothetical protein
MGPSALTLIRAAFLDRSEVSLGCLVPNLLEPGQDFHPVKPPVITPEQINTRYIENIHDFLGAGKHIGLRTKLARIFSATARKESKSFDELVARRATLCYLRHPSLYFENLCDDDDTKVWLETVLKRFPIFLVTGFLTVTEAQVGRARQRSSEVQLSAKVSASDVASSGATTVVGNMPDQIGVELNAGSKVSCLYSFVAPGERIIGVQYRKLRFNRFSAVDVEKAELKSNSWVMFSGDRCHKGISAGPGYVEANLEESLTVDDLELEEQEDEQLTVEEEEFVFLDE